MPNTKSAAKAARQAERRTVLNRALKSKIKTFEKKFLEAAASGNADTAGAALKEATAAYAKAAKKGVIKKGKASRKQSRLQLKLNAVAKKK
jgi:small subunit ribosomal protein S20